MPVAWSDWSDEAFRRARDTSRPILLALGAPWSSWSRIMEREAYSDPGVTNVVAARFVAIRVDIDRRPDVNDRYNPGAVPAVALLDPLGVMLYATAYMDANELRMLLSQFLSSYTTSQDRIAEAARQRDE
jgi:uncharacterized protein YyaL (SSP411 family)